MKETKRFTASPPAQGRPPLLLVEDHIALAKFYEKALGPHFDVTLAHDGNDAASLLKQRHFDIILSDVIVPGITGVDLLRIVRAYDLDVPVILMSGAPEMVDVMTACDLGAAGFLSKPIVIPDLIARLQRAMLLRRLAYAKREAFEIAAPTVSMQPTVSDRAGLVVRLDKALESLRLVFQPIVHTQGRKVVAFEALMRSSEPAFASPLAIVDAAEKLAEVPMLTSRIVELAAAAMPRMPDGCALYVNIHADDLRHGHLGDARGPLAEYASRVVFEITERGQIDTIPLLQPKVRALRTLGYRLAIDDLGAGFAGLTTFVLVEPDVVKIDMALIRGIDTSIVRQRVVTSIVRLCRELSISVIAEGVETSAELSSVIDIGCEMVQGYRLGRPGDGFSTTVTAW